MRTSPRTVVCLFVILLFGSFILPLVPNVEENPITQIIESEEEISPDIDEWDQLNDAQKKAMVDWTRKGDSQNTVVNSISSTSLLNCENETTSWSIVHCGIEIHDLEFDSIGNLYLTGTYRTSATFDETFLVGDNWNIFVAKLDVKGSWVWIADAGSERVVDSSAIAVDSNGSVYIGGQYDGNFTIGNTTLIPHDNTTYSEAHNEGYEDMGHGFVSKLDNTGSWLWVKNITGDSLTYVQSITLDSNEDLLISFSGCGHAYMDDIYLLIAPNDFDSNPCSPDVTIAKLNNNGEWLWASTSTSSSPYYAFDIHVDSNDSAYIVGIFTGLMVEFGNETSWNLGSSDGAIYVAKLDSNGTWLWTESAYGYESYCALYYDWELDSDIDPDGNIAITGGMDCYTGFLFGDVWLYTSNLEDAFVAKISKDGEWQWAVSYVGSGEDKGTGIAIDSVGNIYSTGLFEGQIAIGSADRWLSSKTLTSSGGFDVYLAKMDTNGTLLWTTKFGGSENEFTKQIGISDEGKIVITGYYRGTTLLSGSYLNNGGEFAGNKGDSFIFSLDGNVGTDQNAFELPLTKLSTTSTVKIFDIAVDADGNAHITGYFAGIMVLGGTTLVTSMDEVAVFVAKISKTGEWLWAVEAAEGPYGTHDIANSIAVDDNGDIYITGRFSGFHVAFGHLTIRSTHYDFDDNHDDYYNPDIFVAKLNSRGEWQWANSAGGIGWDEGSSVAVTPDYVYVTGQFSNCAGFGNVGGSNDCWDGDIIRLSNGGTDIFVGMLDKAYGDWEDVLTAGGAYNDEGVDVDISENENVVIAGNCAWECEFTSTINDNEDSWKMAEGSLYTTSGFVASAQMWLGCDECGKWVWLNEIDSYGANSSVSGLEIAGDNYIYITGNYKGSVSFEISPSVDDIMDGITPPDEYLLSNFDIDEDWNIVEYQSMYVASVRDSLYVDGWEWVQHVESPNTDMFNLNKDSSEDIAVDIEGNIYITGYYNDTVKWNNADQQPDMIANYYTIPSGEDLFVLKLVGFDPLMKTNGYVEWTIEAGGSQHDSGTSIALDSSGVIYSAGYFQDYASFGGETLISSGYENAYVSIGISGDFDGDGYPDTQDDFVFENSQWSDQDGDGFGDNILGYHGDNCPTVIGSSWQDRWGCPDMDGDGQSDLNDAYMQDNTQWNDTDGDGLGDNWDGVVVDRNGSSDGIGEYWENAYLPDPHPLDYDNDGFQDANLQSKGAIGPFDDCPFIYGKSVGESNGCIDSDGDGVTDSNDAFSGDATQWNDTDGDGFGDSPNGTFADQCVLQPGNSTRDRLGCLDQDGDGWSVISDWDDNDSSVWSDSDGDGFTDQLGHPLSDDCPGQPGYSSEMMRGCADMDGDGLPDIYDDDTDGDGISNSIERQAGHDPYDGNSTPKDFDNDGVPDSLDDDDDDDGFPDQMESERGSDPKDAKSTPLSMYGSQESGVYYVPGQGFSTLYQEDGYEISVSWLLALVSSEFLVPLILLPLSILLLMGKRRRFKKFKKRMGRIDQIDELEELEVEIDSMIEKGSIKVEHAMLLRNQFERSREQLSGKSHMDRLFTNSRERDNYQPVESVSRPNSRPARGGPPQRGPPRRGPPPLR